MEAAAAIGFAVGMGLDPDADPSAICPDAEAVIARRSLDDASRCGDGELELEGFMLRHAAPRAAMGPFFCPLNENWRVTASE